MTAESCREVDVVTADVREIVIVGLLEQAEPAAVPNSSTGVRLAASQAPWPLRASCRIGDL